MTYVQLIDGLVTVPIGDHLDEAMPIELHQEAEGERCEFDDSECTHDGLLWTVGDFGSPYFCTAHYFPQEQLGYELLEAAA